MTHDQQVLNAIRDAGRDGIENWKLAKISLRYGDNVFRLRKKGYEIRIERDTQNGKATGTFRYFLELNAKAITSEARSTATLIEDVDKMPKAIQEVFFNV